MEEKGNSREEISWEWKDSDFGVKWDLERLRFVNYEGNKEIKWLCK